MLLQEACEIIGTHTHARARIHTHPHPHTHTHKIAMSGKSQFSQLQNQYDHISMLVGTLVVFLDMHVDLDLFSVSTVNLIEFFSVH